MVRVQGSQVDNHFGEMCKKDTGKRRGPNRHNSFSFIHMYIHCLGHFSTLSPALSLCPHPTPASMQNLFCPFLSFVEE
jgi:hypothetical protein